MDFPSSFTIISDEVSQDLPEIGNFLRRFQLSGFELRSMFGRAFKDLTPADLAEISKTARGEGWKIYGCSSPVLKCEIDDEAGIKEHVEIFKHSIEAAKAVDASLIRVFTFLRRPEAPDAERLDKIAGHLRTLIELAAPAGIRVGVENEASCIIASADETLALIPRMPKTGWGVIWDPCNALYVPEGTQPVTKLFPQLYPSVIHIHIKDAARRKTPGADKLLAECVPVGLGDVNWRDHFAEIRRLGYQGMLSLETHWRVVQIDEHLLHLPAGYGFSKGGEEASAVCLRNMQGLWPVLAA